MITALTPTGARPEAFAACVAQMAAQTVTARWVIVDDGPEPMPTPQIPGWEILHLRPDPCWQPGQNTLARNILHGLPYCSGRIAVIEDDDAYADWWLVDCDHRLDLAELVGESHSLYINRLTGARRDMGNDRHASLCSTALRGRAIEALAECCRTGATGIDLRLWRHFGFAKRLWRPEPRGVTGIKSWPGRPGIGVGHHL
ncbi:hypothetical protein A9320_26880 [Ruegeria sp. PBVC088]|nr:hypothetical protein A9320_26880 [Ruegeria sp. PBVC088]